MNIIFPACLIVCISWISFWINREASPARVTLGVTTVLTMTTLITTTNNSMPKVSYVKGLDVFLNFCFVMVFASLVEYALVHQLNKRQSRLAREKAAMRVDRSEKASSAPVSMAATAAAAAAAASSPAAAAASAATPVEMPFFASYPTFGAGGGGGFVSPPYVNNANFAYSPPSLAAHNVGECDCHSLPLAQYTQQLAQQQQQQQLEIERSIFQPLAYFKSHKRRKRRQQQLLLSRHPHRRLQQQATRCLTASGIDRFSRVAFPVVFFVSCAQNEETKM